MEWMMCVCQSTKSRKTLKNKSFLSCLPRKPEWIHFVIYLFDRFIRSFVHAARPATPFSIQYWFWNQIIALSQFLSWALCRFHDYRCEIAKSSQLKAVANEHHSEKKLGKKSNLLEFFFSKFSLSVSHRDKATRVPFHQTQYARWINKCIKLDSHINIIYSIRIRTNERTKKKQQFLFSMAALLVSLRGHIGNWKKREPTNKINRLSEKTYHVFILLAPLRRCMAKWNRSARR